MFNLQTPDGKALGRWINNQRSAKNKGTLKTDREVRLVSTGLKWSVLSTNAWPDMMNELRIYVRNKVNSLDSFLFLYIHRSLYIPTFCFV